MRAYQVKEIPYKREYTELELFLILTFAGSTIRISWLARYLLYIFCYYLVYLQRQSKIASKENTSSSLFIYILEKQSINYFSVLLLNTI